MEVSKYISLKDKPNTFEDNYKSVNGILFLFSLIGNCASIVFAYFFLYNILAGVTDNFFGKAVLVAIITVTALSAFELLKRFLFKQTASLFLNNRSKFERYSIGLLSVLIIGTSCFLSISGANTLSNKSKVITSNVNQQIATAVAGINAEYATKTDKLDKQISFYDNIIQNGTKSRVLRAKYNDMITETNNAIDRLDIAKKTDIATAKADLLNGAGQQINDSNSVVRSFIFLSAFIELIILIGVGFDTYYNHRVYADYDILAQTNRKYRYYVLYNRLLDIVYSNGKTGKDDFILSACILARIAKTIDLNVTTKQANDFYSLLGQLKVAEAKTRAKRIALTNLADAKTALKAYYKI